MPQYLSVFRGLSQYFFAGSVRFGTENSAGKFTLALEPGLVFNSYKSRRSAPADDGFDSMTGPPDYEFASFASLIGGR